MTLFQQLKNVREIHIKADGKPVCRTAAEELQSLLKIKIVDVQSPRTKPEAGVLAIGLAQDLPLEDYGFADLQKTPENALYIRLHHDGSGCIAANKSYHLYGFVCNLIDRMHSDTGADFAADGFRALFCLAALFLRLFYQPGRTYPAQTRPRGLYPERRRMGFTHIDVNGLASPMALETGPKAKRIPCSIPIVRRWISSSTAN
jgi:hypothetical protein